MVLEVKIPQPIQLPVVAAFIAAATVAAAAAAAAAANSSGNFAVLSKQTRQVVHGAPRGILPSFFR